MQEIQLIILILLNISNPLNSEEESRKLIESKFDVIVQPTIKRDSFK